MGIYGQSKREYSDNLGGNIQTSIRGNIRRISFPFDSFLG